MQIIVVLGQSGMGKSTFMNSLARKELAKTGKHAGQTSDIHFHEFERDKKKYLVVDTVGTLDNRDIGLTDEKILNDLQTKMGMHPKDTKIVFVLTQALTDSRLNLAMETEKYTKIFGNSFLKSSLILATKIDKLDDDEIDEATKFLKEDMSNRLSIEFPIQLYGNKSPQKDQMMSDTLLKLQKLPSYSNDAIAEVQNRVEKELQNQKNKMENKEKYSVPYTDQEQYPVERLRTVTYQDTEQVPTYRKKMRFLGINTGKKFTGFDTVTVDKQRSEGYVDYETRNVTKYRDEYKLKYSHAELLKKAQDVVAAQIKADIKKQ